MKIDLLWDYFNHQVEREVMSISSFFFQGAYFSIGIGAICYFKKAVGYKHIRKLEEAYQKALLDGREPSGIEAAGHADVQIMKFCLVLMCVGVLFLIFGLIIERLDELL